MSNAPLGIIAGGGDLPRVVAESACNDGRDVFVLSLVGDLPWASGHKNANASVGEVTKTIRALRNAGVKEVLLAGKVDRPRFSDLKLDTGGVLALPKVVAAARKGDDALLKAMVSLIEAEGFRVVGVAEAAPGLVASGGAVGRISSSSEHADDIEHAYKIVRTLGALDVGQGAVVCEGLALAVEAAEGTDRMLERVAQLPERIRGTIKRRKGVLVKAAKPIQDGKTDLPVIGVSTVQKAGDAGLAGIAFAAGETLLIDRGAIAGLADALGMFIVGIDTE